MSPFISLECPCGRTLRVKADLAGTAVQCWDCQTTLVVPGPRMGGRVVREYLGGVRRVLRIEVLLSVVAGGLAVSCALAIPVVGPVVGLALLAAIATLYPEVVRRTGHDDAPAPPGATWTVRARQLAWGPVLAIGLTAPVLLRHAVMDGYGVLLPLRGLGIAAVALGCWLMLPLVVAVTSACGPAGPLRVPSVLAAIRRHPLATAMVLFLPPVGLLTLEVALVVLFIGQGWFGYLVMDLFPPLGANRVVLGLDAYDPNLAEAPLSSFLRLYVHGLSQGYTMIGALPASLPRGPILRTSPWFPLDSAWYYLVVRILDSVLILAVVGVLLAIEARWLGLIATFDSRPPVPVGVRERGGARPR
jgi:hypothetical protein